MTNAAWTDTGKLLRGGAPSQSGIACLTGDKYFPSRDEYGTNWQYCARPSYMNGWDYEAVLGS